MTLRPVLPIVVGGLLTPVATGLSLQVAPMVAPALLYGVLGLIFGYRRPQPSWRWGLWLALGMALVTAVVAFVLGIVLPVLRGDQGRSLEGEFEFVRITALFAVLPGLVGGVLGSLAGARLARGRPTGTAG
jgi:uncharacterized membrane protein YfcA